MNVKAILISGIILSGSEAIAQNHFIGLEKFDGIVTRVINAGEFWADVKHNGNEYEARITIWGLDAAEMKGGNEYYWQSRNWSENILSGAIVNCEVNGESVYPNIVAKCRIDGRDYAEIAIASGHGIDCTAVSGGLYAQYEDLDTRVRRGRDGSILEDCVE